MGSLIHILFLVLCISSTFARTTWNQNENDDTEISEKILAMFAKQRPVGECPIGWLYYRGYCYHHYGIEQTWKDAWVSCRLEESYLADIQTEDEQNFIANYLTETFLHNSVWTSALKKKDGDWVWPTGEMSYTAWGPGQPDQGDRMALNYEDAFLWYSKDGAETSYYLCKKPSF